MLGSYNAVATTTDNKSITITGDESNPGKVWVDGLSGSRFYALLKTVPGTYKIPAQKQDDHAVAEGTLIYDDSNKQIYESDSSIYHLAHFDCIVPSHKLQYIKTSYEQRGYNTSENKSQISCHLTHFYASRKSCRTTF